MNHVIIDNGAGLNQDGSLRAQNNEKDASRAALELFLTIFPANFPGVSQQRKTNALMRL